MTADSDRIPISEEHRGVGIHAGQPPARVEVVKAAIDDVYSIVSPSRLLAYLESSANPPEARLFAAARLRAAHELAAESRISRPNINLMYIQACVAGLQSLNWRHPHRYTSLLDPYCRQAAPREEKLTRDLARGLHLEQIDRDRRQHEEEHDDE